MRTRHVLRAHLLTLLHILRYWFLPITFVKKYCEIVRLQDFGKFGMKLGLITGISLSQLGSSYASSAFSELVVFSDG